MTKLQILENNEWKYVFCRNKLTGIVTTKNQKKALPGHALKYFQDRFGNDTFHSQKIN